MTRMDDALAARDRALRQVDENADERWKAEALAAVRRTCELLPEFVVDAVWETGGLASTREDRALGPVMRKAAGLGWMERTDRVRPSARSNGAPKPLWKSRLFEPSFGDGRLFSTPPARPGNALTEDAA